MWSIYIGASQLKKYSELIGFGSYHIALLKDSAGRFFKANIAPQYLGYFSDTSDALLVKARKQAKAFCLGDILSSTDSR